MSIVRFIKSHEGGKLRRVRLPRGIQELRGLWLAPEPQKVMDDVSSAIILLGARPYVQSALERWVGGGLMRVRLSGRKPGASLARLEPPPSDIWEFRVTEPVNQVRVFFRFADKDLVIVTNMHTRRMLGGKNSLAWPNAMKVSESEWVKLFPGETPHLGNRVNDL